MYFVPEGQHDSSQARSAWTGVWTFQEGKTTRQPEGGMAPSRLYHRRPACVLVSAPTATLPSPGRRRLLLVHCKPRFASTIPSRKSGSNVRALDIEAGARGNTGGTPMLLWTDCRAYLLAERSRSPTINVVRNSAIAVLEMSKLRPRRGYGA